MVGAAAGCVVAREIKAHPEVAGLLLFLLLELQLAEVLAAWWPGLGRARGEKKGSGYAVMFRSKTHFSCLQLLRRRCKPEHQHAQRRQQCRTIPVSCGSGVALALPALLISLGLLLLLLLAEVNVPNCV